MRGIGEALETVTTAFKFIWEPGEDGMFDAVFPMGFIGTSVEDDGSVSWVVHFDDDVEGRAATDAQARADAQKALIERLEAVLAQIKGST